MSIEDWWSKLKPTTREWLVENNGDAVPAKILVEITAAGGAVASDAWWEGQAGPSVSYISDEATDWIEAAGNGLLFEVAEADGALSVSSSGQGGLGDAHNEWAD